MPARISAVWMARRPHSAENSFPGFSSCRGRPARIPRSHSLSHMSLRWSISASNSGQLQTSAATIWLTAVELRTELKSAWRCSTRRRSPLVPHAVRSGRGRLVAGAHPGENQHRSQRGHDQADPPEQQREEKRDHEQRPGHRHGNPAGPVPGTCRPDGQDDRSRGSGDEQQNPQYPHCHRAYALASPSPLRNARPIPSAHPSGVDATAIHAPTANLWACVSRRFETVMSASEDESRNRCEQSRRGGPRWPWPVPHRLPRDDLLWR
jgi:hypothetical protein